MLSANNKLSIYKLWYTLGLNNFIFLSVGLTDNYGRIPGQIAFVILNVKCICIDTNNPSYSIFFIHFTGITGYDQYNCYQPNIAQRFFRSFNTIVMKLMYEILSFVSQYLWLYILWLQICLIDMYLWSLAPAHEHPFVCRKWMLLHAHIEC